MRWNLLAKRILAGVLTGTMMLGGMSLAATAKEVIPDEPFNPDGVYHATLGLQVKSAEDGRTWQTRKGYYFDNNDGTSNQEIVSDTEGVALTGEFKDVEIDGNGTYTVSFTSSNLSGYAWCILQVATDIYKENKESPVQFSDLIVTINNVKKASFAEPFIDEDSANTCQSTVCLTAFNDWRDGYKSTDGDLAADSIPSSGDVTVELTFTVNGFHKDHVPEETKAPETKAPETEAVQTTASETQADNVSDATQESVSNTKPDTGAIAPWVFVIIGVGAAAVVLVIILVVVNNKKKAK